MINRINAVYDAEVKTRGGQIPENILSHEAVEAEMKDPSFGPAALKHLKQNSSLIGLLKQKRLLEVKNIRHKYILIHRNHNMSLPSVSCSLRGIWFRSRTIDVLAVRGHVSQKF